MSTSIDYSAEEWKTVSSAPMMAGLLASVSDLSGPIGVSREAMAVVRAVNETASATSNELIKAVAEAIKAQGGRVDLPEHHDPAGARTALIYRCKQAIAVVGQKSPAELDEYRRWLVAVARKAAEASKERGLLGLGGTVVSEAENSAVRDLALALGVSES